MQRLTQKRFQKRFSIHCGDTESFCRLEHPAQLLDFVLMVRDDPDTEMNQLLDIICEDSNPIKLTYVLFSTRFKDIVRVQVDCGSNMHIPSLVGVYDSTSWLEREVYDLFGVRFDGHPNLKRLLLYPEFAGHPLRKNYPADKAQPLVPIYA
jgi:NADH-quinone oxidoreductase subunit C